MTTTVPVERALAGYAERLHAGAGATHHVASAFGAWLLLALVVPAASGRAREELTAALGMDADTAAALAAAVLDDPHPLVFPAAGTWWRSDVGDRPGLARWLAALPDAVRTGPLVDQETLDAWAAEHTLGLIRRFPLDLREETLLVLATALATRVSWQVPFDVVPAADLGPNSAWTAGGLTGVLRTPEQQGVGHDQSIVGSERAGDLIVHTARVYPTGPADARHRGLMVTSVAAAPDVPAAEVLAVAHEVAISAAVVGDVPDRRSLFDLPLGEAPLWTVTEEEVQTTASDAREERCVAVLPAWSATSVHNLARPELGLPTAAGTLAELLGLSEYVYEAKQSAVARFSRTGFEAAAVSAMFVLASMPQWRDGVRRTATLRFGHPFAVVAVATDRPGDARRAVGPWHGLPVFSAWVTEPENAEPDSAEPDSAEPDSAEPA